MKAVIFDGFEPIEDVEGYKLNLLPHPQELDEIYGFFALKGELGIGFEGVDAEEIIMETIQGELAALEGLSFQKTNIKPPKELRSLKAQPKAINDESYALYFEDNFLIIMADTDKAIYYGVNTFLQLIKSVDGKLVIPLTQAYDYPAYEVRCITDQTSRNQVPTIENLKQTIKLLSKYKINYHFLYMEDSFNFKKYSDLGKQRGGYTVEEIRELQAYAKRYFVELVPIFNMFGHVDNILMTNYPKYADLGEFPGSACYDINNPKLREFITDLLKELCESFESSWFHLGLDETFDFGMWNTRQIIKEQGKATVMHDYYNFLIETAKRFGKNRIICYHDNLIAEKELLTGLPKDLVVFYWNYFPHNLLGQRKKKYKKAQTLRNAGYQVILSPTLYDYTRNFPDTRRTIDNIVSMAQYGLQIDAIGIATSVWGDFLNENLRENNYFGYLVTAEAAWAPQHWDTKRFKENFAWFFYGATEPEIIQVFNYLNAFNDVHPIYPVKFFSHIWRHPFPSKKFKPKVKKLDWILQRNQRALDLLERLKPRVKRHADNLDYLIYAAKLGVYLGIKYRTCIEVQKELNRGRDTFDVPTLVEKVTHLSDYLAALRKQYAELWLRCAKPNGLELILEKFDAHLFYYSQKIQEIEDGIIWRDPFLKAEFISTRIKVERGAPIYLRKNFELKRTVKHCYLQGMCDMFMRLYLNGEKLGEIVSKMSLSVEPIKQRIQLFDITNQVRQGKNVIAAECHNYLITRVAGNIYMEIEYDNGEKEMVISNAEWKASALVNEGWEQPDFDDTAWPFAKSLGAPPKISGHITQTYPITGIKSQDNSYYAMSTFLKGVLPWAPLFLIEIAKKFLGMEIF